MNHREQSEHLIIYLFVFNSKAKTWSLSEAEQLVNQLVIVANQDSRTVALIGEVKYFNLIGG